MTDTSGLDWQKLRARYDFVAEVFEQPQAIEDFIHFYFDGPGIELLSNAREYWNAGNYSSVAISGMGSSLFAGRTTFLNLQACGIPCLLIDAGELCYYILNNKDFSRRQLKNGRVLFLLTSQSGKSAEIIEVLKRLQGQHDGIDVWAITNSQGSTLAKEADLCFLLKAGVEKSVTSKTFCNSLIMNHLLSRLLISTPARELDSFLSTEKKRLSRLSDEIRRVLQDNPDLGEEVCDFIGPDVEHVEIIARGYSLASASQASLNIKETNKISAEAISGGQFRHGPIEMIDNDFRSFVLISDDSTRSISEKMVANIVHAWGGGKAVVITNKDCDLLKGHPRIMEVTHGVSEPSLAPVLEIVIIQLFMIAHAVKNGIDPGVFRYSSKVTREL
ncbi:MAG: SIS domain-containing protein [Promethearchaeota archaeon]